LANPEHVRILKRGVEVWNQWRSENPGIQPNLRGQSFKGQDLSGADFSGADIRSADFSKATLRGANFSGAKAELQRRWAIATLLLPGFWAAMCGCHFLMLGSFGWIALIFLIVALFLVAYKGRNINSALVIEFAGVISAHFRTLFIVSDRITTLFAFVLVAAVPVAITGLWLFGKEYSFNISSAVAAVVAVWSVGAYIGWHSLEGESHSTRIYPISVSFPIDGKTSFYNANLSDAIFNRAMLRCADFRQSTLKRTSWHQSKKLNLAFRRGTILAHPQVRELVVNHQGAGQSFKGLDLRALHLPGADLSNADLTEANISDINLEGAWLEGTNLTRTQAWGTNFHQARLTGACLEDWVINRETRLDGIICKYVYLLRHQKERCPLDREQNFAPGDFAKIALKALSTVDLIFRNGVDWKAFVTSFKQVQVENEGVELSIQSIENKGDGVVVVRVQASADADKEKIHRDFSQMYQAAEKALEAKYRSELRAKDEQIAIYRQQSTDMVEITKLLAVNQPKYDLSSATVYGFAPETQGSSQVAGGDVQGNQAIGSQHNYSPECLTLADVAAAIQRRLQQLAADNPAATESEQQAYLNLSVSPTLRRRFLEVLQTGWREEIALLMEKQYAGVAILLLERWQADNPNA